jgi:hypothetical protein
MEALDIYVIPKACRAGPHYTCCWRKNRQEVRRFQQLETWQVKSCDVTTTYLLVMVKSPQGGTDIATMPLGPAAPHFVTGATLDVTGGHAVME